MNTAKNNTLGSDLSNKKHVIELNLRFLHLKVFNQVKII